MEDAVMTVTNTCRPLIWSGMGARLPPMLKEDISELWGVRDRQGRGAVKFYCMRRQDSSERLALAQRQRGDDEIQGCEPHVSLGVSHPPHPSLLPKLPHALANGGGESSCWLPR